ncbi:MAG: hypothetical protein MI861_11890, partial [Pirellulales bacterium]|nr:hypothetical protein [Pirellulales bacterium]
MASGAVSPSPDQTEARFRSSYVVAALVLTLLCLLNLPGRLQIDWDVLAAKDSLDPSFPRFQTRVNCLHGWPMVVLRRAGSHVNGVTAAPLGSYWHLLRDVKSFHPLGLIINLLVGWFLVRGAMLAFDRWRRKRKSLLQMHVIDVLAIASLVAIVSCVLMYHDSTNQKERSAIDRISKILPKSVNWGSHAVDRACWLPSRTAWIREARQQHYLSVFDRVVGFSVSGEELPELKELKHLRYVQLRGEVTNGKLQTLTELPQLEVLDISVYQITDKDGP